MTLQQIKEYIKRADLVYQDKLSSQEINDYKNMAFYLVKNYYFSKSIRSITPDDLDLLLDGLIADNEIITKNDIYNYNIADLGYYYYNQVVDNDKMLLLNFYNIDGILQHCKMVFTKNYNIL